MLKNKKTMITMVSALCALATVGGVSAVKANAAATTLEGFTCAGASVNAEEIGVRFEFNLEGSAVSKSALDAGVVYVPYDLYTGDATALTKETANVATAEFGWEANEATQEEDYKGYAELPANAIPVTQYNRVLLVRGYIEDGENTYYTAPVKTSMAYSAWKGAEALPAYADALKAYMGPYTLYSDAGNVENLYYGDTVTGLATSKGGKNIAKWYWDEEKTNEIKATDYATGSMNVYYEYEKFAVTGTVSGASNLETVKIQANGVEVGTVQANGEYTLWLEAGNYDLRFYNDSYVAYATVEVAAATTKDVALVDNTWEVGDYNKMKTQGTEAYPVQYDPADSLDGSIKVTGREYNVVFPNTATANAFTYSAKFGANVQRNQTALMLVITDGSNRLAVGCYQWEGQILASVGSGVGMQHNRLIGGGGAQSSGTMKFVRTLNKIEFYVNDSLIYTFTKGKFESTRAQQYDESLTSGLSYLNSFFEEGTELAVGVASLRNWTVDGEGVPSNIVANYSELTMQEFATVTGKVSVPQGSTLDVTKTTLKVGGAAYDMTVDAQGNFTAYIPEGTQTLEFANGAWGATAADVVVSLGATNTVNVELADYTWAVGTFGSHRTTNMSYDAADALDGSFAVTSTGNGGLLFPNLATTGNFTFEVAFTGISREGAGDAGYDDIYGICISNGSYVISIGFQRWEPVVFNMGTSFGAALIEYWNHGTHSGYDGSATAKLKFVRTAEKIEFYYADVLYATFTDTATYSGMSEQMWGSTSTAFRDYYATYDQLFIGADKNLTVGLITLGGCKGFTANCSFTNN